MIKVLIIVPVHNRSQITLRFVDCLLAQTYQNYVLVLVDDGSTDGTAEVVADRVLPEKLVILRGDGNLWWAGALQLGYEWLRQRGISNDEAVLICNDDVDIAPDFLANGVALLERNPATWIGAVGIGDRTGRRDRGTYADLTRGGFISSPDGRHINCLSTRGLLMTAISFLKSGGFRPNLLPHYLSDYEFTIRANRKGIPLITCDGFSLVMNEDASGVRNYSRDVSFLQFLRLAFSNRATFNPIHWQNFYLLCAPKLNLPLLLSRVWLSFFRRAFCALADKHIWCAK